jgi:hypothetical protein
VTTRIHNRDPMPRPAIIPRAGPARRGGASARDLPACNHGARARALAAVAHDYPGGETWPGVLAGVVREEDLATDAVLSKDAAHDLTGDD